ncbi:MAG: hypothetical protein DKM23_02720 [Candidatus Melainabacteria bacterium]|nr:MAG: hypothetical protein DKM24_06480 [Candidatus Melainabacteria bacterium]RAI12433.1 MAG: hypothetical protein DKM23_02720 [Candidatus Melainabacteria bacterium]
MAERKIESANPAPKQPQKPSIISYTKEQYYLFFTILICSFALMFWLCNFTIMKETFQIIMMSALSIALAEYFTRRYFKL